MNPGRIPICYLAVLALSAAVSSAKNSTPVKIEQTVDAQFPPSLSFTTITSGEARVMINVDSDGNLADVLVTGYTDPAFASEAISLVKHWRYKPATLDGQAVGVRLELKLNFVATGRVISLTALDATNAFAQRSFPRKFSTRVCAMKELDRPIAMLEVVSPLHPGHWENAAEKEGSTLIDFYVDESGLIRMPVVMETTNQNYAKAAVSALSQWRFTAPMKQGKPIAVRVQQKFIFPET